MSPISVQACSRGHFLGWHGDMGLARGIAIPLSEGTSSQNEKRPGRLDLGQRGARGPRLAEGTSDVCGEILLESRANTGAA